MEMRSDPFSSSGEAIAAYHVFIGCYSESVRAVCGRRGIDVSIDTKSFDSKEWRERLKAKLTQSE
jgi:hypothetical protein